MARINSFGKSVGVAVAIAAACALTPMTKASADNPPLVGTWAGQRERIASTEGYRQGPATLVITEQTGMTFRGTMTWSTPAGDMSEPLVR